MPELPEVETVIGVLKNIVIGKRISEVEIYWNNIISINNIGSFKHDLIDQEIINITRRGKYILMELTDFVLITHLRMEGKFYFHESKVSKDKHTHVIICFSDDTFLHYHDVRKFGKMYLYHKDEEFTCLSNLGPEPWDKELTVPYLKHRFRNKKHPIKTLLLDQSIVAGIGNIYANEICFSTRIDPRTSASHLSDDKLLDIIVATQSILEKAIQLGGTTIKSYTSSLGVTGLFQQELFVHGRENEPCKICSTNIEKIKLGGRGTYYCPSCQELL